MKYNFMIYDVHFDDHAKISCNDSFILVFHMDETMDKNLFEDVRKSLLDDNEWLGQHIAKVTNHYHIQGTTTVVIELDIPIEIYEGIERQACDWCHAMGLQVYVNDELNESWMFGYDFDEYEIVSKYFTFSS